MKVQPIQVDSVVNLAHDQIRGMILRGDIPAGGRLGQGELAGMLGISRTSVREALRRLTGDGLAEFHTNRGFFVADIGLDGVLRRLEVRVLLEPGIARLAAERRTDGDLAALRDAVSSEREAKTAQAVHDASRAFHVALAGATGNEEIQRTLEQLWIVDVGRRLLARRRAVPSWQGRDVAEHETITAAVVDRNGDLAEQLMRQHVEDALGHWSAGLGAEEREPAA
jgi:DNA-binding GntR family transcriptional regulator